ncbi:MAG: TonB-dependent receptor family protein [Sediminibacterium sp.]|nr:TonB-dependent receptor family protein [Sediminibacterium sp.]
MKVVGFFMVFFLIGVSLSAQSSGSVVTGRVYDSLYKKGLSYATVSVVQEQDSTLVSFTRADSTGKFRLSGIPKGNYLISFSYVGYLPVWKSVRINAGEQLSLGDVPVTDLQHAGEVIVTAKRPPVTINNDTVEFNTENFKTQPNAVVEDLLKKLPGVTVDKDGTVQVNGQRVNRFLVNGKEFFTGDPKLATRNLDADAIDKVQVFDKKSDRSEFTGVDDGQSEKAINLKLKKDRNNALFGKITAGAGTKERYDAQANVNQFKGDRQASFIGMGNNTNRQGFSLSDVMNFTGELARGARNGGGVNIRIGPNEDNGGLPVSGMGPNQQGIATTYAGGLNYNNSWNRKTDLNLNGIGSDVNLSTNREISRQNLLPGNSFIYNSTSSDVKQSRQQRLNAMLDQRFDSFTSIRFTPQITLQQNDNKSSSNYISSDQTGVKLNEGSALSQTHSEAFNLNSNLLLRHRFKKKGRTISSTISLAYNSSKQNGNLRTANRFYTGGIALPDSVIEQINSRNADTRSIGANLVYTEPVGKTSLLEFSGFYNTNTGKSIRNTYDYNGLSGKYDRRNLLLSNDFNSRYQYGGGGINFRSNIKKLSITTGANLQFAALESSNNSTASFIQRSFTDVLPSLNIQYRRRNTSALGLIYSTSTAQPSTFQLQPVADISDPLNTYVGNPDLKRSYTQSVTLNMSSVDIYTQNNLFAYLSYSKTDDAVVTSDIIKPNGSRISTPVNANGNYYLVASVNAGKPLKKLKSRVDLGISANLFRNMSLVNGVENAIDNYSITPNIGYNFAIDTTIDISFRARLNLNTAKYALQPQLNNSYVQQVFSFDMNNYLPGGLVLNNDLNMTVNSGRSDGFNATILLWNLSLSKSFLKQKRAELRFSVMDLLNQNAGINRTANQNFVQDTRYNVLQRYFQLSFSYRLNRSGDINGGARVMFRAM